MTTLHELVTNDWFLFTAGISSIIGGVLGFFACKKLTKKNNMNIKKQSILVNGNNNKVAGRDNVQ